MCYHADYQEKEIAFEQSDIFHEKNQLLIKDARNRRDKKDKTLPRAIPLHELRMSEKDKQRIKDLFEKQKTEKTTSKTKKYRQLVS